MQTTGCQEEDFQSGYKPQASNRRKPTALKALNEIFITVIDYVLKEDRAGFFHAPVKNKDAPNYTDIIKSPMDLGSMKSKAKRQDYKSMAEALADFRLISDNAMRYNGDKHPVAEEARKLVATAEEQLNKKVQEIE